MQRLFVTILLLVHLIFVASSQSKISELDPTFQVQGQFEQVFDFDLSTDAFSTLMPKVKSKHHQDTSVWMERIFYFVQRKYLKHYTHYASLDNLKKQGKYDCVTGTLLYSMILTKLKIEHSIVEFPYHVAILVDLGNKKYMLESTDPLYGFVKNEIELADRLEFYRSQSDEKSLRREINVSELLSLYYYNQAVVCYNEMDWRKARTWLEKANAFSNNERIYNLNLMISYFISEPVTINSSY